MRRAFTIKHFGFDIIDSSRAMLQIHTTGTILNFLTVDQKVLKDFICLLKEEIM